MRRNNVSEHSAQIGAHFRWQYPGFESPWLHRETVHILETVKTLTDRGVTLVSTTDGIDSSTSRTVPTSQQISTAKRMRTDGRTAKDIAKFL
jgi:hypothetical protein